MIPEIEDSFFGTFKTSSINSDDSYVNKAFNDTLLTAKRAKKIQENRKKAKYIKLVLVGDTAVGKSCLIDKYVYNKGDSDDSDSSSSSQVVSEQPIGVRKSYQGRR